MPNWKKVITSGSDAQLNSLLVTNGITGSLLGNTSTSTTASYALTASYIEDGGGGGIFAQTGSFYATTNDLEVTGSLAVTGYFGVGGGIFSAEGFDGYFEIDQSGDATVEFKNQPSGSFLIVTQGNAMTLTGSTLDINASTSIYKSGSTVFNVEGSSGQLFSVTDTLSGSLYSVNDISGLPIFEVFSDDTIIAGAYNQNDFVITGSQIGIGKGNPTSKLDISGSLTVTGSIKTQVVALSISSNTASMDCTLSNSFTLELAGGTNTYLNPTNIQPGQSINLKITQDDTEAGTIAYGSNIKFSNTLPYSASATLEAIDIISFTSFDSTTLYASALKDFN